jgi:predicted nucleotidyltransferase
MNVSWSGYWYNEVVSHYTQILDHFAPTDQTVWATMLYGSQNYDLSTLESDVDTKTMLLPGLSSIARNDKAISTELVRKDGSLDNCKDLREMFGNYLKGNINFVETLYTPYYYVHEDYMGFFDELRAHRDLIANARPVKLVHMAGGMAEQKYKAFDHPFESKKAVLEKYGYDPKQLHHQYRLLKFIETYFASGSFYQALLCCDKQIDSRLYNRVMLLKIDPLNEVEARHLNEEVHERIKELVDGAGARLPEDNGFDNAKEFLDDLAYRLMRQHLFNTVSANPQQKSTRSRD